MDAVRSGWTAGGGPWSRRLVTALAARCGTQDGVTLASGTIALEAALRVLDGESGAVAIPAYACLSLRRAVLRAGRQPREVDVRLRDLSFDPESFAARTQGCAAAIAVHQFGVPTDINALARATSIPIIEDITTAIGGTHARRPVGGIGRLTVVSAAATKLLAGGEGGVVLGSTRDVDRIRAWSNPESSMPDESMATRAAMSEMACAVAATHLLRLDKMLKRRREIAEHLGRVAEDVGLEVIRPAAGDEATWWRLLVLAGRGDTSRDVVARAHDFGVVFAQPVVRRHWEPLRAFPVANELHARAVSVPTYPALTDAEVEQVASALIFAFGRN